MEAPVELFDSVARTSQEMRKLYDWPWVDAQVSQTVEVWDGSAQLPLQDAPRYGAMEQQQRERVYDEGLRAVEGEARKAPRSREERIGTQDRILASFARFSASALDLEGETVSLLTHEFLPAGTKLATCARQFDASLSMAEIIQACRNAWTACGLQSLMGERIGLTPSILGYSLLYPYSDNYLDRPDISAESKIRFSQRFRARLRDDSLPAQNDHESALWALVRLIEGEYPRAHFPHIYDCLLAIHQAQEESIAPRENWSDLDVLRMSCAKGGTSVVTDACLAHGALDEAESRFSFEWGVLLQLGDDLQDLREDMQRGSVTLFTRAVAMGKPLDDLVIQLLSFSERVGAGMDSLPQATERLKRLMRMSWRSLIIGAVAESHKFFSPGFLHKVEECSPFRFAFLRARRERLASRQGLYAVLFEAFLEAREEDSGELLLPAFRKAAGLRSAFDQQ
jgi:hypothetical protein